MTKIKKGKITITDITEGDALNFSVLVTGWDLAGKHVAMDVKPRINSDPVLRFTTEDGSIETEYEPVTPGWIVTFKKTSTEMKIRPGKYILDVESYTDDDDTKTFAEGTMEIMPEVTKRLK